MRPSRDIEIFIPTPLRRYCGGRQELRSSSASVQGLLEDLATRYPRLHPGICDETGAVRRHINIFVNEDHIRDLDGTKTSLATGDVVTIMTAVSGG